MIKPLIQPYGVSLQLAAQEKILISQRIIAALIQAGKTPVDVTRTITQLFGPIPGECRTGAPPDSLPAPPREVRVRQEDRSGHQMDGTMKPRPGWIRGLLPQLWSVGLSLLLWGLAPLLPGETLAAGNAYYLSPGGTDSNSGLSPLSPWKTFAHAATKLNPGDTLILRDGTYTNGDSGYPSIHCAAGARSGTADSPITLKAENERRAFLSGDGSVSPFFINGCSYWTIEGLHIRSSDNRASSAGDPMDVRNSSHITFRRLLVTHNNRYTNSHLLSIADSNNMLVEESEFYFFHRHAILNWHTNNSTYRRNYFNSRLYPDLADGRVSHTANRGDGGISIYPGSHCLLENNISENNEYVAEVMATDLTIANRMLGNISLNDQYGLLLQARGTSLQSMVRDAVIRDLVVINSVAHGFYARAAKNARCDHCMILNSGNGGMVADGGQTGWTGDGSPTFYSDNSLVVHSKGVGFYIVDQSDFLLNYSDAFNNKANFSPSETHSKITNELTLDPQLGTCTVWIPDHSPMKGAGKDGAAIGANILYRYENGILTDQPLWNPVTGRFPCGEVVTGVNDIAGASCFDVHQRLNVNSNGCPFPSGYGQRRGVVSPPTNLRIR